MPNVRRILAEGTHEHLGTGNRRDLAVAPLSNARARISATSATTTPTPAPPARLELVNTTWILGSAARHRNAQRAQPRVDALCGVTC